MMVKNIFLIFVMVSTFLSCSKPDVPDNQNLLYIPELIDSRTLEVVDLTLKKTQHKFFSNTHSETMGINASYLGPTLRLQKGMNARIRFTNKLGKSTTIHDHGLHVNNI